MLSFARFATRAICSTAPKNFSIFHTCYAQFTVRDVSAVSYGESGTVLFRFIKHIALESCKIEPLFPYTIKYSDFYPITDHRAFEHAIRTISTNQIPRLIIFTYTYKTNGDPQKVARVLNALDKLSLDRIDTMDLETIFSTLYALMYLLPSKITKFEFYPRSIERLVNEIDINCPKERFVELCLYLGLWKKHRRSIELASRLVSNHLERYIDQLSSMEFAIVSNALFKSSTICDNTTFRNRLIEEVLKSDGKDEALLVTFVKSLRLNRVKSEQAYEKLWDLKSKEILDKICFKSLTHIFALFADGAYNRSEVCDWFVKTSLEKLETEIYGEFGWLDVRSKDISTFIWSCATLDCKEVIKKNFGFLESIIISKIQRDEYKYDSDELIDTVLSFWILEHKSEALVQAVLNLRPISSTESTGRVKLDSRLDLLKSCIQIEQPDWISENMRKQKSFNETRIAPRYLLDRQVTLQNVRNTIEENKDTLLVRKITCIAPIYQLNIASILLESETGGKVFVEVVEENHRLRFEGRLRQLMQLKLRLLEKLGCNVVLVNTNWNKENLFNDLKTALKSDTVLNVDVATV